MIILLVAFLAVAILVAANSSGNEKPSEYSYGEKVHKHSEESWRAENGPGSFTIYDKKGAVTVSKTYEGGERYIDGHRCSTTDDMDRWYVKKGLCEGYERRLHEIEHQLSRLNAGSGDELIWEWKARYQEYRQLCIDHGFWNRIIEDRSTFIPTSFQATKEREKVQQIEKLHLDWKQRMIENRIVLDYLEKCPRKHALKNTVINDLSEKDPEKKKQVSAIYKRLKTANIIAEKQNVDKRIETRIIVRRSKAARPSKPLPASTFDPSRYSDIRRKDIYKVDYTVQEPQNLNRETNTCTFISKSSGETYSTSLEKCTCPAYYHGGTCKHMLALAIRLGYYDRYSAKP